MTDVGFDLDIDLAIDLVEGLADTHHGEDTCPGFAYGVVLGGRQVHTGARGVRRLAGLGPDAGTVFRIASMTKSFTAATVLALRDEGRLRLDDPVAAHVPEAAKLRTPTRDAPEPTIRSLLTMTAGLPTDDPWGDRQQDLPDPDFSTLLEGGLSFAWTPGTAFEYSNLGYALLGRVISAASGQAYPDAVTTRLLTPLGMASTGYIEPADEAELSTAERMAQGYLRLDADWEEVPLAGYGAFAPMGGLFSTVTDLLRWVGWLCGAFPPRDDPDPGPLSRASRRELQLPHLALPPAVAWTSLSRPPAVRGAAYGFGLIVEQDLRVGTLVSHSGGYPGFGSHMRWHPGSGLGVVVLGNATYAPAIRLGTRIVDALLARARHVTRRPGSSPAPVDGSMVAATEAARADVTRLVTHWDDAEADRLLAMNVHLDDPLPRRRRMLAEAVERLGPLESDADEPVVSHSPAHCVWWLTGPGGRLRCEIRMTPEVPSRVQTLTLTAVPTPPQRLRHLAGRLAALLGEADPRWPDDVPLAGPDPVDLTRQLQVASAWAGPLRGGTPVPVAGDGVHEAVFRLDGARLALRLTLAADGESVSRCALAPEP